MKNRLNDRAAHGKPLTLREAAEYLDLSTSHLCKLTSRRQIPHFKPSGKRVYFVKEDLDAYLLRNRVELQGVAAKP